MPFYPADGSTASACEIRGIHEFSWKHVEFMIFMEKCGFRVKTTRKQPFVPEAENDSKTYAFLHGWEAVRVLLYPELGNSLNPIHFS